MAEARKKINKKNRITNLNSLVDKKIEKALNKNIETKYWTQIKTATTADYTGTVWDLSLAPEGYTDTSRNGDRLHLKKIILRLDWLASSVPTVVRVIIFQWFGSDVPTISKVLLTTAQAEIVHSPYFRDYFPGDSGGSGFILKDFVMALDVNATAPRLIHSEITGGFRPNLQYTAGTTAGTNHIYVAICADRTSTTLPTYRFYGQLFFTDA